MTAPFSSLCEFCALGDQESQSLLLDTSLYPLYRSCLRPQGRELFPCLLPGRCYIFQACSPLRRAAGNGTRSWEL